jgi:hypothetical protein
MNRRGTEPYARWCGRTAGVTWPPTRLSAMYLKEAPINDPERENEVSESNGFFRDEVKR